MQNSLADERQARREAIRARLAELAEPQYAAFNAGLMRKPGEAGPTGSAARMLGVRLPALRKLARQLAKENWQENLEALAEGNRAVAAAPCYEELLLQGILIGCPRPGALTLAQQQALIQAFVPLIDNWAICDSFCAGLKCAREYPAEIWDFLQEFLRSKEEYGIRFGLVMILNYYITEDYLERLFPIFDSIRHEGYYVKMAVAWAVSICYVNFPERTQRYLEKNELDDFTYGKALQKIIESRCISDQTRAQFKKLRDEHRARVKGRA